MQDLDFIQELIASTKEDKLFFRKHQFFY